MAVLPCTMPRWAGCIYRSTMIAGSLTKISKSSDEICHIRPHLSPRGIVFIVCGEMLQLSKLVVDLLELQICQGQKHQSLGIYNFRRKHSHTTRARHLALAPRRRLYPTRNSSCKKYTRL